MRTTIMIVSLVFVLAIFAIGVSNAQDGEYAGVYKDSPCYIGGVSVSQDETCPHGYLADSSNFVETPGGRVIVTCHFDSQIPDYCLVEKVYMNKDFKCGISYTRDDGTRVSLYTDNSMFVKTPDHQAMLRCIGDIPPQ